MFRHKVSQVLLTVSVIAVIHAKVGFVKDQSEDVEFPVFSEFSKTSTSGAPLGHLRPLGWQRKPERKLYLKHKMTEPADVWKAIDTAPFLFENVSLHSEASQQWDTDDFLKKKYGNTTVSVTVKKEVLRKRYLKSMTLKKFLLDYMYEDWALTNTLPKEMESALPLPWPVGCGSFTRLMQEVELWMSSGGTSSLLHSHDDLTFHCVLFGRKDFIFIDPQFKKIFEFQPKYKDSMAGHSPLDMDMVNMYKYKKIAQVPWKYATLKHNDCVIIPAGYLHQVRSYGRSISFSILIAGFKQFDRRDCPRKANETIASVHKTWTYINGTRQLSHSKITANGVRVHLLKLMRADGILTFECFENFFYDVMQYHPSLLTAKEVFRHLDPTTKGYVTKKTLLSLPHKSLVKVADALNAPNIKGRDFILHDEF